MNPCRLLLAFLAPAMLLATRPAAAELPPLIPRDVLFGDPQRAGARLSPDGARLGYLARSNGVLNVWIRVLDTGESTQVTRDTRRGIPGFFWTGDGQRVLYLQDSDGDENLHVFSVELASGLTRDLTPFQGIRAENVFTDPRHPHEILVGLNLRERSVFDIHRIDLITGAVRLDTQNPGDVISWTTDQAFVVRAATALDPKDGSAILRVRDHATAPWRDLVTWSFEEAGLDRYQKIVGFTPDGAGLYVQSPVGANTTRLVTIDVATGRETTVLAADPSADLWNVYDGTGSTTEVVSLVDPVRGNMQAVAVQHLKPEWKVIDPAIAPDLAALGKVRAGAFTVLDRDATDARWLVRYEVSNGPAAIYLYERATRGARFLFENRPDLAGYRLAEMKGFTFKARDGLEIPAYLTLPEGVPPRNLPLVLMVHGGPWYRDEWGYDPTVQWLANRGYAVLQVQFRGSTGFGNQFLNAGTGGFGVGAMQHDLTDGVRWAIQRGIADPKRVAIMGGSYGGYATLAGLAFTPELYACGVDIVGPSNIRTLIESFPSYWALRKKRWLLRVGDVIADESLNHRISPLFHVDRMQAPLLIGHGANDPRVKIEESERIVAALRAKSLPVSYVVYSDEGHGFGRSENAMDFNGRAEEFLAKHLGGRAEPWVAIQGASASVK